MTSKDELCQSALEFDPVNTAIEMSGLDSRDKRLAGEAFLLHRIAADVREQILEITGDTDRFMSVWDYVPIAIAEGFLLAYRENFTEEDVFLVLVHPDENIILLIDSHRGQINGANIFFNWRPTVNIFTMRGLSGHMTCPLMLEKTRVISDAEWADAKLKNEHVFVGSSCVIDGLSHRLSDLRDNGTFVEWIESPSFSLVHCGDAYKRDVSDCFDDYTVVSGLKSMERFLRMPIDIQFRFNELRKSLALGFSKAWQIKYGKK